MDLLGAAAAEWRAVRVLLWRSRLGIWLAVLVTGNALLVTSHPESGTAGAAVRVGLLAGIVAGTLGADRNGAALLLTLTHPVTAPGLAAARGLALAAVGGAAALVGLAAVVFALATPVTRALVPAAAAGVAAAAAGTGAALGVSWVGGTALTGFLFAYVVFLSGLSPEVWGAVVRPGAVRATGVVLLATLASLWRYRELAAGDASAWLHAAAWAVGGALLAGGALAARRR
jgi:hypothetical protein